MKTIGLRDQLDELNWATEHVNESLAALYGHAITLPQESADLYFAKRRGPSQLASILRLCAIQSISIGAVGPLISSVWSFDARPFSSPLSATLFATVAGTFIGIDRALGANLLLFLAG